ncbi:MAG: ubiquitin-like small modifier protein 1 [Candidatus Asgardarchaeia archaeon]
MGIRVKFFAALWEITGEKEVELNGTNMTVRELLQKLIERYGEKFKKEIMDNDDKVKDHYVILVNGRNIVFLDGVNTKVKDGDLISIFPPVGGG